MSFKNNNKAVENIDAVLSDKFYQRRTELYTELMPDFMSKVREICDAFVGNVIKFNAGQGHYFAVYNIEALSGEHVLFSGTRIVGMDLIPNEQFAVDYNEQFVNSITVLSPEEFEKEIETICDIVKKSYLDSKRDEDEVNALAELENPIPGDK